jgi:hypothetical protein
MSSYVVNPGQPIPADDQALAAGISMATGVPISPQFVGYARQEANNAAKWGIGLTIGGVFAAIIAWAVIDRKKKTPTLSDTGDATAQYNAAVVAVNQAISTSAVQAEDTTQSIAVAQATAEAALAAAMARDWDRTISLIQRLIVELCDAKISGYNSEIEIQNINKTNATKDYNKVVEDTKQNNTEQVLAGIFTLGIHTAVTHGNDEKARQAAATKRDKIHKEADAKIARLRQQISTEQQKKSQYSNPNGSIMASVKSRYDKAYKTTKSSS